MNVTDYTLLINKPESINEKQTDALSDVLDDFPYFQSARALRLKGLYNQNSFKYNYALKVTAAHSTDRAVLFEFITSNSFTVIQKDYYEKKTSELLDINVKVNDASTLEEKLELPNPVETAFVNPIQETSDYENNGTTVEEKLELPNPVETAFINPIQETSDYENNANATTVEEKLELPNPFETAFINPIQETSDYENNATTVEEKLELPNPVETAFINPIQETSDYENNAITVEEKLELPNPVETAFINPIQETSDYETNANANTLEEKLELPNPVETAYINPIQETSDYENNATTLEEKLELPNPVETAYINPIQETSDYETNANVNTLEEKLELPNPVETTFINPIQKASDYETNANTTTLEEKLEIGKPLDFSVNEQHSFQEWLQISRIEPIERKKEVESSSKSQDYPVTLNETQKKKLELIDKFIETNPKIPSLKQLSSSGPTFDLNKDDHALLMTETLAKVYLEQKKYLKAIQAYEILILKYPEKSSFFADRILDIKILQQNNNN